MLELYRVGDDERDGWADGYVLDTGGCIGKALLEHPYTGASGVEITRSFEKPNTVNIVDIGEVKVLSKGSYITSFVSIISPDQNRLKTFCKDVGNKNLLKGEIVCRADYDERNYYHLVKGNPDKAIPDIVNCIIFHHSNVHSNVSFEENDILNYFSFFSNNLVLNKNCEEQLENIAQIKSSFDYKIGSRIKRYKPKELRELYNDYAVDVKKMTRFCQLDYFSLKKDPRGCILENMELIARANLERAEETWRNIYS